MKILPNIIFSRQSCNKQKHHSPIDRLVIECNGIIITWVTWLFEVCTDSVPRPSKYTEVVGGWGFAPDPTGGAYSAPPDPLAGFRGPTSKGRGGEGRRREGILLRNSFRGLVTPLTAVAKGGQGGGACRVRENWVPPRRFGDCRTNSQWPSGRVRNSLSTDLGL